MKNLTSKEEEILTYFWQDGDMFVKDLLEIHPEPKPHYNTLSIIVRALEEKGFVDHKSYGKTYQYFAKVSEKEYKSIPSAKSHHDISKIPLLVLFLL